MTPEAKVRAFVLGCFSILAFTAMIFAIAQRLAHAEFRDFSERAERI